MAFTPKTPRPVPKPPQPSLPEPILLPIEQILPEPKASPEQKVVADLRARLAPPDLEVFSNIFSLFANNIVSYNEFVKMIDEFMPRIGKDTLVSLKSLIDQRENSRKLNCRFNNKLWAKEMDSPLNRSYKKIEPVLRFVSGAHPLINKTYMCQASGSENAPGNIEEQRKCLKNSNEIDLLKVEDEMHEFDSTLAQLAFASRSMHSIAEEKITPAQKQALINKVSNTGILVYIFGPQSAEILRKTATDAKLAAFVEKICSEKLESLRSSIKHHFEENWHKVFNDNYYKALDLRSNSIKSSEKKYIS